MKAAFAFMYHEGGMKMVFHVQNIAYLPPANNCKLLIYMNYFLANQMLYKGTQGPLGTDIGMFVAPKSRKMQTHAVPAVSPAVNQEAPYEALR